MSMSKLVPDNDLHQVSPEEKKHLPVINESETVSIRLSGTAINNAGQMTSHKYFDFLGIDLDDYSDLEFTPEEAKQIRGHLSKMSTGSTAMVPLICKGPECPFRMGCDFFKMNKAPLGRQCLIELNLMREWTIAYFNDYKVDPNNFTEVTMINELAEIEVYQWRLNQTLARAENAELVNDSLVNITPDGTAIFEKKMSPYITAKETLLARKARLIKLMVGDRQEKYKKEAALKQKEDKDPSSSMAEIRTKLEALQRDVIKKSAELASQSGKLIDIPEMLSPEDIIGE